MFNKVILVGRFTADPELRQTPNGVSVCSFTLAVDRSFSSKGGEKQTDFIDCVAWRERGEFISRYFSKGRAVLVEGQLQVRSYTDKNDQKRRAYEVVVDNARFVESKNAAPQSTGSPFPTDEDAPSPQAMTPAYSSGSVDDFAEIDDDGDLPF